MTMAYPEPHCHLCSKVKTFTQGQFQLHVKMLLVCHENKKNILLCSQELDESFHVIERGEVYRHIKNLKVR